MSMGRHSYWTGAPKLSTFSRRDQRPLKWGASLGNEARSVRTLRAVSKVLILARTYRRCSSAERLMARRALDRSELNGSKAINEAALEWAVLTIAVIIGVAAVVLGFAVANASAGNERAIPLFVVGAVTIAMAGRVVRRYAEFRRLLGRGTR
jgi:hypothetical protein